MKWTIVGLGNPTAEYASTRHNVGKELVAALASNIPSAKVVDLNVYMNNSGLAVKKLIEKFKMKNEKLIVVHDDLDIPLGKFHIQFGVGPQLHNGLESIEQHLKTKDFWRVRIGVDNRQPKYLSHGRDIDNKQKWIEGEKYSLQNFLSQEKKLLETEIFSKIFSQLKLNFKML